VVTTAHGPFTAELRDVHHAMADKVAVIAISHTISARPRLIFDDPR
jgi:hypothetical protein